ncbi:hypothetical protein [Streptomyces griseocarneus]|uniref:hypothetical protein n=1 Tax=Streptomyces griseocarneus TaxID=51201 RepID=UPI00167E8800|nr:hypothetical protein [Streptomyces griseocarneus]MBZ6477512.1 hypothetical protein [Streptomyces griseocarneus]GHG82757.1 hypothetical protein GCM10018779_65670 [Streptomyces griseocarneus]
MRATGSQILDRVADVLALLRGLQTLRCPEADCLVRIRFRAVISEEVKRLTALATDHTLHAHHH